MLTEFGGIAFTSPERSTTTWGYSRAVSALDFEREYARLLETVRSLPLFAGFCYTQFADTYQESNGLLYADRTPKIPLERIAEATTGRTRRRSAVKDAVSDSDDLAAVAHSVDARTTLDE
jgi:hypothetical protein